jgi:hypothetical protein
MPAAPLSLARTTLLAVLVLTAFFTAVEPAATAGLPPWTAAGYWLLHIGGGLLAALAAAAALARTRWATRHGAWLVVLASGILGTLLFAPLGLALEGLFDLPDEGGAEDALDLLEARGGVAAVAAEFLQVAPEFTAAWALLNASPLLRLAQAGGTTLAAPGRTPEPAVAPASAAPPAAAVAPVPTVPSASFLARLPPAIGSDVVLVTADLHYLQVETTRGRATLLGSLAQVEADLGESGLRIHRSHWVAQRHVRRIWKSANGWQCEMRSGQRLPISRRRVAAAQAALGRDFVVAEEPAH